MATLKTKPTEKSIEQFLEKITDEQKKSDSYKIMEILSEVTAEEPVMWGDSIIGFGSYHYKYESGREGDWMLTGFSPRKQHLTVYLMTGFDNYDHLLEQLGKYKLGKSCLYFKKLEDIDVDVLRQLVKKSIEDLKKSAY